VVHKHNVISLNHKNECICASCDELDKPRSIVQSEVSQKEEDKYYILMQIYGIMKNGSEEFIYRAAMEKQIYRIDYGHGEIGGEGEMYGKSNMET